MLAYVYHMALVLLYQVHLGLGVGCSGITAEWLMGLEELC